MSQRVVLITGANGGIGTATVELFHAEGWYVVGLDQERQRDLAADHFLTADLGEAAAISATFEALTADLDGLDALVNNAAVSSSAGDDEPSAAEWDRLMAVNLRAAFLTTRHALPLLRARSGCVVNVSSVHAYATARAVAPYAASKGGLLALTRGHAMDLAAEGIRVNAVVPGAIDTPMLRHPDDGGTRVATIAARTPMKRIGQPAEVAHAIFFLADGTRSSFVTGSALTVDGGALAQLSTE